MAEPKDSGDITTLFNKNGDKTKASKGNEASGDVTTLFNKPGTVYGAPSGRPISGPPIGQYESGLFLEMDRYKTRARRQPTSHQIGRTVANLPVNIGAGIIENAGYLGELAGYGMKELTDQEYKRDFSNSLTEFAKNIRNPTGEVYRENQDVFDFDDPAWWLQNGGGLVESIGEFLVTGAGVGKVLGSGAKYLANGINNSFKASRATRLATAGLQAGAQGLTGATLGYVEGAITGAQVYKDVIAEGGSVAEASEAASTTVMWNTAIIGALNTTGVYSLFRGKNLMQGARKFGLTRRAGEGSREFAERMAKAAKEPSGATKSFYERFGLAIEGGQESIEEVTNLWAETKGKQRAGIADTDTEGLALFAELFQSEEGVLSAVLGALGGVGQTTGLKHIPFYRRQVINNDGTLRTPSVEEAKDPSVDKELRWLSASQMENMQDEGIGASYASTLEKDIRQIITGEEKLKKAIAENDPYAIEAAKRELFNVSAKRSIPIDGGEAIKASLQEVADMDNETDLGGEITQEIGRLQQELEGATREEAMQIEATLAELEAEASELSGVTPAMAEGFTDSPRNSEFKELAREKIEELQDMQAEYLDTIAQYDYGDEEAFNMGEYVFDLKRRSRVAKDNLDSVTQNITMQEADIQKLQDDVLPDELKTQDGYETISTILPKSKGLEKDLKELKEEKESIDSEYASLADKYNVQTKKQLRDAINDSIKDVEGSLDEIATQINQFKPELLKEFKENLPMQTGLENAYKQQSEQRRKLKTLNRRLAYVESPKGREEFIKNAYNAMRSEKVQQDKLRKQAEKKQAKAEEKRKKEEARDGTKSGDPSDETGDSEEQAAGETSADTDEGTENDSTEERGDLSEFTASSQPGQEVEGQPDTLDSDEDSTEDTREDLSEFGVSSQNPDVQSDREEVLGEDEDIPSEGEPTNPTDRPLDIINELQDQVEDELDLKADTATKVQIGLSRNWVELNIDGEYVKRDKDGGKNQIYFPMFESNRKRDSLIGMPLTITEDPDVKEVYDENDRITTEIPTDVDNKPMKMVNGKGQLVGYLPTMMWLTRKDERGDYVNLAPPSENFSPEAEIAKVRKTRQMVDSQGSVTTKVNSISKGRLILNREAVEGQPARRKRGKTSTLIPENVEIGVVRGGGVEFESGPQAVDWGDGTVVLNLNGLASPVWLDQLDTVDVRTIIEAIKSKHGHGVLPEQFSNVTSSLPDGYDFKRADGLFELVSRKVFLSSFKLSDIQEATNANRIFFNIDSRSGHAHFARAGDNTIFTTNSKLHGKANYAPMFNAKGELDPLVREHMETYLKTNVDKNRLNGSDQYVDVVFTDKVDTRSFDNYNEFVKSRSSTYIDGRNTINHGSESNPDLEYIYRHQPVVTFDTGHLESPKVKRKKKEELPTEEPTPVDTDSAPDNTVEGDDEFSLSDEEMEEMGDQFDPDKIHEENANQSEESPDIEDGGESISKDMAVFDDMDMSPLKKAMEKYLVDGFTEEQVSEVVDNIVFFMKTTKDEYPDSTANEMESAAKKMFIYKYNKLKREGSDKASTFLSILQNWDKMHARAVGHFEYLGYTIEGEEKTFEGEQSNYEKRKFDSKARFKENAKDTASSNLKLFLSSIPDEVVKDGKRVKRVSSWLGFPKLVPMDEVFDKLTQLLVNEPATLENFKGKLQEYKNAYPPFGTVLKRLNDLGPDSRIPAEFKKVMSKQYIDMIISLFEAQTDRNGDFSGYRFKPIHSDRNSAVDMIYGSWVNAFRDSDLVEMEEGRLMIKADRVMKLRKKYKEAVNNKKAFKHPEAIRELLEGIGVKLSESTWDRVLKETTKAFNTPSKRTTLSTEFRVKNNNTNPNTFLGLLFEKLPNDDAPFDTGNPFSGDGMRSRFRRLAFMEMSSSEKIYTDSFTDINGNTIYPYQMHSQMSTQLSRLKNDADYREGFAKAPFHSQSSYLNAIDEIEIEYIDGLKNQIQKLGFSGENLGRMDTDIQSAVLFFGTVNQTNGKKARMQTLTKSDKTTYPIIFAPKHDVEINLNDKGEVSKLIAGTEQRIKRIIKAEFARIRQFELKQRKKMENQGVSIQGYNSGEFPGASFFVALPQLNAEIAQTYVERGVITQQEYDDVYSGDQAFFNNDNAIDVMYKIIEASLIDDIRDVKSRWKDAGILNESNDYIDSGYLYRHAKYTKLDSRLEYAVADFTVNHFIAMQEEMMTFSGDPATYWKPVVDGETGQVNLRASLAATYDNMNKRLAKDIAPRSDGMYDEKTFTMATIQELEVRSEIEKLDSMYGAMEIADAQEFTTVQEHLRVLKAEGQISPLKYDQMMEKVTPGQYYEFTADEMETLMSPMKPLYTGFRATTYGVNVPVYTKSSSFPLVPQMLKEMELDTLREHMENKGVDRTSMETANKQGATNPVKVFDKNGRVTSENPFNELNVVELDRAGFGIQQEVPVKEKKEINVLSQLNKLMFSGMRDTKGFKFEGREYTGRELEQVKENIRKSLIHKSEQQLIEKLGVTVQDGDFIFEDLSKVKTILKQEAKDRGWSINAIDSIQLSEDKQSFTLPLALSSTSNSIESLMMSLVSNIALGLKATGYSYVQGSSAGMITQENANLDNLGVVRFADHDPSKGLQFVTEGENAVEPAEIYVRWDFKDNEGNVLDINDFITDGTIDESKLPAEARELLGVRIPTQGHNSVLPLKIAGFIPPGMGTLAIVPKEIVAQMGSDFDVDKLYTYRYPLIYRNGKLSKADIRLTEPLDNESSESGTQKESTQESDTRTPPTEGDSTSQEQDADTQTSEEDAPSDVSTGVTKQDIEQAVEEIEFIYNSTENLKNYGSLSEYMDYLSTVFPDSKIKGVLYHGGVAGISEFKTGSQDTGNRIIQDTGSEGIYLVNSKSIANTYAIRKGMELDAKAETYPVLVNSKNIKNVSVSDISTINEKPSEDTLVATDKKGNSEIVVFEPSQVHILGSEKDIQKFSEYIQKTTSPFSNADLRDLQEQLGVVLDVRIVDNFGKGDRGQMASINSKGVVKLAVNKVTAESVIDHLYGEGQSLAAKQKRLVGKKLEEEYGITREDHENLVETKRDAIAMIILHENSHAVHDDNSGKIAELIEQYHAGTITEEQARLDDQVIEIEARAQAEAYNQLKEHKEAWAEPVTVTTVEGAELQVKPSDIITYQSEVGPIRYIMEGDQMVMVRTAEDIEAEAPTPPPVQPTFSYDGVTIDTEFVLGDSQQKALRGLIDFVRNGNAKNTMTLQGAAGTGKTTIIGYLEKYMDEAREGSGFKYLAPTHAATAELAFATVKTGNTELPSTIASSIRQDWRTKEWTITSKLSNNLGFLPVFVIDESSMVDSETISHLREAIKRVNGKLILMGDEKQIPAITTGNKKTKPVSSAFTDFEQVNLTDIYRQSENSLLQLLSDVRAETRFNPYKPENNTDAVKVLSADEYAKATIEALKTDPENTAIIAYTNNGTKRHKGVKQLNQNARAVLGRTGETVPGDIVVGYLGYASKQIERGNIANSIPYTITEIRNDDLPRKMILAESAKLRGLKEAGIPISEKATTTYFQLSKFDSLTFDDLGQKEFDQNNEFLAKKFAEMHEMNQRMNRGDIYYPEYLDFIATFSRDMADFSVGADYVYNPKSGKMEMYKKSYHDKIKGMKTKGMGTLVFKKDIDYGHAITVHKSQGTTIGNVFFNIETLEDARNPSIVDREGNQITTERQALAYVGMSRSQNQLVMPDRSNFTVSRLPKDPTQETGMAMAVLDKTTDPYPEMSKEALTMKYIELLNSVYRHPDMYDKITSPLDKDDLGDMRDEINSLRFGENPVRHPASYLNQIEYRQNQRSAQRLVGIFALANTLNSLLEKVDQDIRMIEEVENNGNKVTVDKPIQVIVNDTKFSLVKLTGEGTTAYGGEARSASDNISLGLSASVDNANENILGAVNWNQTTAGVVTALLMSKSNKGQAVNLKWASAFTSQPVIHRLVQLVEQMGSTTEGVSSNAVATAIATLRTELQGRKGGGESTQPLSEDVMMDMIGKPLKEMTSLENARQLAVLRVYEQLNNVSEEIRDLQQVVLSPETSGVSNNVVDTLEQIEDHKSIMSNRSEHLSNLRTLLVNNDGSLTEQGQSAEVINRSADKLISGLLPEYAMYLKPLISSLEEGNVNITPKKRKTVWRGIKQYINSTVLKSNDLDLAEERRRLFYDDPLGKRVMEAKATAWGKENYFIKRLSVELTEDISEKPTTIEFSADKAIRLDDFKNVIALNSMLMSPDKKISDLAKDLILYDLINGGVQNPVNFSKYIHPSYLSMLGLDTKEDLMQDPDVALTQIVKNNPTIAEIVESSADGVEILEGGANIKAEVFEQKGRPLFVSMYNTEKGKWEVYKYAKSDVNVDQYDRLPTLGITNENIAEYYPGEVNPESVFNEEIAAKRAEPIDTTNASTEKLPIQKTLGFEVLKDKMTPELRDNLEDTLGNVLANVDGDLAKILGQYLKTDVTVRIANLKNAAGTYTRTKNKDGSVTRLIEIDPEGVFETESRSFETVILHEAVHVLTSEIIAEGSSDQVRRLEALRKFAQRKLINNESSQMQKYKFKDIDEFVAFAMSDPTFQKQLNDLEFNSGTAFDQLIDIITSIIREIAETLGIEVKEGSVLAETVKEVVDIMESQQDSQEETSTDDQGRPDLGGFETGSISMDMSVGFTDNTDPAINQAIASLKSRMSKIKANISQQDKGSRQRQEMIDVLEKLEKDTAELRNQNSAQAIKDVAKSHMDWIKDVIDNPTASDALFFTALSLMESWDIGNTENFVNVQMKRNNAPVYEAFKVADNYKTDVEDLYIDKLRRRIRDQINADLPTSEFITSKDLEYVEDIGFLSEWLFDLSTVDNKLAQYIDDLVTTASRSATEELGKWSEKLSEKAKDIDDFSVFKQEDAAGNPTGEFIDEYSHKYHEWRNGIEKKLWKSIREANRAGDDSMISDAIQEYHQALSKINETVDTRILLGEDFLHPVWKSKEEYVAHLKKQYGEEQAESMMSKAEAQYQAYKKERNLYVAELENVYETEETDLPKDQWIEDETKRWENRHNPLRALDEKFGAVGQPITTYTAVEANDYLTSVPRKKIRGQHQQIVDSDFYDSKFEKLTPKQKEFYEFYIQSIDLFKKYLPNYKSRRLGKNFLPRVSQDLVEEMSQKGMSSVFSTLPEKITDSISTGVSPKLVQKELEQYVNIDPSTGVPQMDLLSDGANAMMSDMLEVDERSFNIPMLLRQFAGVAINFKYKSAVEDRTQLALHVLRQSKRLEKEGGKTIKDRFGNLVARRNGKIGLVESTEYFVEAMLYGKKREEYTESDVTVFGTFNPYESHRKKARMKEIETERDELELERSNGMISPEDYEEGIEELSEEYESLGGKNLVWGKMGDRMLELTQMKGMGWNLTAGIANVGFGLLSNMTWAASGQDFTDKDLLSATWKVMKSIVPGKKNYKIANLIKKFDVLFEVAETEYGENASERANTQSKTYNFIANYLHPFEIQRRTEYQVQGVSLVAQMLNKKITVTEKATGEEVEISLFDAFNDKAEWKDIYEPMPEWDSPTSGLGKNEYSKFKNKVIQLNKYLHGNYDPKSPLKAKKYLMGRMLMQFRTWMPMGFAQRFGKEYYDRQLGRTFKGRYRTFKDVGLKKSLRGMFGALIHNDDLASGKNAGEEGLSDVDLANLKMNLREIQVLIALIATGVLLKSSLDEDDEEANYTANILINQLYRVEQDVYFYLSPRTFEEILKNPIPVMKTYQDFEGAVTASWDFIMDEEFKGDRLARKWGKAVPLANQYLKVDYLGKNLIDR